MSVEDYEDLENGYTDPEDDDFDYDEDDSNDEFEEGLDYGDDSEEYDDNGGFSSDTDSAVDDLVDGDGFNYDDSDDDEDSEEGDEEGYSEDLEEEVSEKYSLDGDSGNDGLNSNSMEEFLSKSVGHYTMHIDEIDVRDVVVTQPVKDMRRETFKGLTTSLKEIGLLSPLSVMESYGYSQWRKSHDEKTEVFTGRKYILIDGFRRLYSLVKLGRSDAEAKIYEFDNPAKATEHILLLRCIENKREDMDYRGLWKAIQILESTYASTMNPDTIEYLLNMHSGDSMKLKEIMTSKYPEVQEALFDKDKPKTLDQVYKMLEKERKAEDKLEREDTLGIGSVEGVAETLLDDDYEQNGGIDANDPRANNANALSDDERNQILDDMAGKVKDDSELGDDDFEDPMDKPYLEGDEFGVQDVHNREILDPHIKQMVFQRDNLKCQFCGVGGGAYLGALVVHHIIEVKFGGNDAWDPDVHSKKNNLITLCATCHTNLHYIAWVHGKIPMAKSEYDSMTPAEKERIRKIKHYATIVMECERMAQQKGIKDSKGKPVKIEAPKHHFPTENRQPVEAAFKALNARKAKATE